MSNREKALELADDAIERIKNGNLVRVKNGKYLPNPSDLMSHALILVLADISQQLEGLRESIDGIWADGIGVG